jgi:hypothetical protein
LFYTPLVDFKRNKHFKQNVPHCTDAISKLPDPRSEQAVSQAVSHVEDMLIARAHTHVLL